MGIGFQPFENYVNRYISSTFECLENSAFGTEQVRFFPQSSLYVTTRGFIHWYKILKTFHDGHHSVQCSFTGAKENGWEPRNSEPGMGISDAAAGTGQNVSTVVHFYSDN